MTGGTSRASSGFSAALPLPFFPAGLLPPSSCKHMHAHNAMSLGDRSTQGAAQEDQKHRQARQSGAQHVDGEDWMRQQRRQQSSSRQYTAKRTTQVLAQRHAGQAALTCWGWAGRAACSCGGGAALAFTLVHPDTDTLTHTHTHTENRSVCPHLFGLSGGGGESGSVLRSTKSRRCCGEGRGLRLGLRLRVRVRVRLVGCGAPLGAPVWTYCPCCRP